MLRDCDRGSGIGHLLAELAEQVQQLRLSHLALEHAPLRVLDNDILEAFGFLGLDSLDVAEAGPRLSRQNLVHDGGSLLVRLPAQES